MPRNSPTSLVIAPPQAGSILAIAAHPDDIESWCAGTLALAIDAGATARLVLVTSGDKGSNDPFATPRDIALMRKREALAAARLLGLADVVFLRHSDGEVEETHALRDELVAAIRRWHPAALFTHDPIHPIPEYFCHRDHRVVGRAALDAVYPLARDRLAFPEHEREGLAPHTVTAVWLFASAIAASHVDISASFERKIAARLQHQSQTTDADALRQGWRQRAAEIGAPAGIPLAEAFTVVTLD